MSLGRLVRPKRCSCARPPPRLPRSASIRLVWSRPAAGSSTGIRCLVRCGGCRRGVLTGNDPIAEAWNAADDITADDTGGLLAYGLPDDSVVCVLGWPDVIGDALPRRGDIEVLVVDSLGEGSGLVRRLLHADVDAADVPMAGLGAAVADTDLVLLEASAIGPTGFIGVSGSRAAAATARHAGVPVWLVGGVGRLMPTRMWDALVGRLDAMGEPWELDDEFVPVDLVDRIAMPMGILHVADALTRIDCPIAPELFKSIDPL